MKVRTVRQLATLAGISVRTLHHYDQIKLLKPSARTEAGYRLYGEADLLRLQQILFFKELDFPLAEIQAILDRPGFDQAQALRNHRRMLGERAERLARLLRTVDRTIAKLTGEDTMPVTDEELYEGFSPKEREEYKGYEAEARERWGEMAAESQHHVRQMSKAQWQAVKDEGDAVSRLMAELMGRPVSDPQVQAAMARQHAWIENFYPCSAEIFRGLGQMYVDDQRFTANYDKYRPGLAVFMRDAMTYYAEHSLAG
ncbi:MAG: MerR family transcriptional regulator [Chloroflexi bacterium]|nr:MerR family transcriptional regulator [Chloroflexota bacterium]